jgi:hypothetical protein
MFSPNKNPYIKNFIRYESKHFKIDFIIAFKNKKQFPFFFEVHHRTKPKSIHLIVDSVPYVDFNFKSP